MLTSPAIQSVRRRSIGRGFGARLAVVVAAGGLLPACTAGSDPGNPLRGPASAIGWATTTGEPKDFVKERRSSTELAYIPVGRPVPQRSIALRNPAGVKSLEEELDRQRERSDAFARRGLPRGAYGRDLPSVAAPPGSGPESYPVSPDRLRQIRENSRQSTD